MRYVVSYSPNLPSHSPQPFHLYCNDANPGRRWSPSTSTAFTIVWGLGIFGCNVFTGGAHYLAAIMSLINCKHADTALEGKPCAHTPKKKSACEAHLPNDDDVLWIVASIVCRRRGRNDIRSSARKHKHTHTHRHAGCSLLRAANHGFAAAPALSVSISMLEYRHAGVSPSDSLGWPRARALRTCK